MGRRLNPDRTLVFRGVIHFPPSTYFPDGLHYYGPYSRRQDAKAALRRENRTWKDPDKPVHPEHIEVSELNWKVDE